MDRIPTARPSWTDEMREAAVSTLDSRHWVKGPKGREFGKKFAEHCGALVATPCQNGSSSLWAALRILGVGKGDEVIVPSYTFISSATAIPLAGAEAVFVDVEPDYWCLDVADSMWLSKVVFPLPRKPVRIVTGTRSRRISHPAYAMTTRDARDPDLSSTQTRTCAFTPAVGRDTEKWA